MPAVMIRCPETGEALYTGIEMDETSFRRLPNVTTRSDCAICGQQHMWTKTQAWLDASDLARKLPSRRYRF